MHERIELGRDYYARQDDGLLVNHLLWRQSILLGD